MSHIIITLIIIQLAKAEWLTFSSMKCLFCSLFIDMTDVHWSKIMMEFDYTFQSWYKTYKNTRKNKSGNLVGVQLLTGYDGNLLRFKICLPKYPVNSAFCSIFKINDCWWWIYYKVIYIYFVKKVTNEFSFLIGPLIVVNYA